MSDAAPAIERLPRGVADELKHVGKQTPAADLESKKAISAAGVDEGSARPTGNQPETTPKPKPRKPKRLPAGEWPDPASPEFKSFGGWLRAAREGKGLSQDDLAAGIGRPKSGTYIGQMERTGRVSREMAPRLLDALEAPDHVRAGVLRRFVEAPDFPDVAPHSRSNNWFLKARKSQGLSQSELALRAEVNKTGLAKRERAAAFENEPRGEAAINRDYAEKLLRGLNAPDQVKASVLNKFFPDAVSDA